jgi:hypothetical protein
MYKVIFNNCWSTKAIPNINKSWQSTGCQALKNFKRNKISLETKLMLHMNQNVMPKHKNSKLCPGPS